MIDNELVDAFKMMIEREDKELDELDEIVNDIIKFKIKNERTISEVFDSILSLEMADEDKKRKVFHKLSNYCRKFDKSLADDYDEFLEENLSDFVE